MKTLKTTEPKQNGEMEPSVVGVTLSPEECTLNGNKQMLITFAEDVQFSGSSMLVVFRGADETHQIPAEPLNSLTYTVLIPAHHKPEQVTLSLISDGNMFYRSHFLYTAAPEHYIAELLVQSVSGTPQLDALLSFVPPLKTKADLVAFDNKLTGMFSSIALPRDWTLVGYKNLKRVETGDTLLHFSARLGLAMFTGHLLKLPGAGEAVNMDNEWGLSPAEVASENSNDDTAKLLNDFAAVGCVAPLLHPQQLQLLLTDGHSEQQQQNICSGVTIATVKPQKGVSNSEGELSGNKKLGSGKQHLPQGSPTLAKIKAKPGRGGADYSVNSSTAGLLTAAISTSCPSLLNAVEQQTMNGGIEYTCVSTSSTNSDELPGTSSEDNSPEPKHRHQGNTTSKSVADSSTGTNNDVMITDISASVSPCLVSNCERPHASSLSNCHATDSSSSNSDTREDSVTPVQLSHCSDQEGTLKRQSSTPVPSAVKSASADSSPAVKRVTSISLYVTNKNRSPTQTHNLLLSQEQDVDGDAVMETQSAPNLLSASEDHESLPTTDGGNYDGRNVENIDAVMVAAMNDIFDTNNHLECSDSSSDGEISSVDDILLRINIRNGVNEQLEQQQTLRRSSQTATVKHSLSDHCLLERTTSPNNPSRKRHSDIIQPDSPNMLYSTGSAPVVSKPHVTDSDLNLSSCDEFGDSTDTLDELQLQTWRDEIAQHGSRYNSRPHSAEITHMAAVAKMRQVHALSSSPHAANLRKVYSSSNIDDFRATQYISAFRSHNKLHPKLVEERQSVAGNEVEMSQQPYPARLYRTGSGGKLNILSRFNFMKVKQSYPVSRNNSDVSGRKKVSNYVSVKRSASSASDSTYSDKRSLSRDSLDYPSSQDSSSLSLAGNRGTTGPALLPPSPLISSSVTPTELPVAPAAAAPYTHRRSGTLSPVPTLLAEDEEPVENVMSQPSIAGIVQARKPMAHGDPEIETSLDRAVASSQSPREVAAAVTKKPQKKDNKTTNLKRAQTMVAESENPHNRRFWFKRGKDKKKKFAATTKESKPNSTYPRPSSATSSYAHGNTYVNQEETNSSANPSAELPEISDIFPIKQMSHRQSGSRVEVRSIQFSPTVSPTERVVVTDSEQDHLQITSAGTSQSKSTKISASSSNLLSSKQELIEQPRKSQSSSELCETEKEVPSNTIDTSVEEDEHLVRSQEEESVTKSFSNYPELYPDHDSEVWSENVPSKVLSKLSKSEKDRQAVIYELIQTENHILVSLHILLIVFKKSFQEELKLPDEFLAQMFPHLDPLLMLTEEFYRKLKQRQDDAHNHVVDRIGDILVEHFTGDKGDEVARAYGAFCSRQLRALDIYREQNKVKRFQRHANSFANTQVCQRRNYPEFITLLAQRITKYPHLISRLFKKTDPRHHDAKDLELALTHSVKVTSTVNQIVDEQSRHEKLLEIQTNLEVHLPRWEKDEASRKEIKSLNLMANGRNMVKAGSAKWVGSQHSQELPVLIVLVTDMIVILMERDQKYSLAILQDRKPPVIRLYDLIVRVNEASAKSSVCELFLMEGGKRPEFYTIQFGNEKVLMEWKGIIQAQIEHCKQNNLKCERFGSGQTSSTNEDKKDHYTAEKVKHGSVKRREKTKENKREKYISLCGEVLEMAKNLLSHSPSLQDFTQLQHVKRQGTSASVAAVPTAGAVKNSPYADKGSPRTRSRANTVIAFKPLSTDDIVTTSKSSKHRGGVLKNKPNKVERSQTFMGKEDKKDRQYTTTYTSQVHRSSSSASGGTGIDDAPDGAPPTIQQQLPPREQLQLRCIMRLVEALEGMKEVTEEQDSLIASLQDEIGVIKSHLYQYTAAETDATELKSRTEHDLLGIVDRPLDQQPLSGLSLEDLRHFPSSVHSSTKKQNSSVTTGRPQSYSELPSTDVGSWPMTDEMLNFTRTMSTDYS